MTEITRYVLSVVAATILCGIIQMLLGKEISVAALGKLITGVVLTVAVFQPLLQIEFLDLLSHVDSIVAVRETVLQDGQIIADNSLADIITEKTQAYIMNRAAELGAEVNPQVSLSDDSPPIPVSVVLTGEVAPYTKQQLAQILQEELGIPKEQQTWM